ncbi:hypothetical protein RRF57_011123 [Xylaria bambusicola]|uniref:Uncharacterized protein n=1 Tax=Xylaria bambusicola TaxID=326684 RepID=A0AAN7UZ14_9PEZI
MAVCVDESGCDDLMGAIHDLGVSGYIFRVSFIEETSNTVIGDEQGAVPYDIQKFAVFIKGNDGAA